MEIELILTFDPDTIETAPESGKRGTSVNREGRESKYRVSWGGGVVSGVIE
jgi:hypothetical protein